MVRMVEPFIICGNINVEKTSDTKKSRLGTFLWKLHPTNLIELPHQHVKINIKSNETENSIIHFFLIRAVKILTTIKNFFSTCFSLWDKDEIARYIFCMFSQNWKHDANILIYAFSKNVSYWMKCSLVFKNIASTHKKLYIQTCMLI